MGPAKIGDVVDYKFAHLPPYEDSNETVDETEEDEMIDQPMDG